MNFIECKGYMIPGLDFDNNYSIWLLRWKENPINSQYLTEVWLFHPDGKRVCYIDPKDKINFFKKYHSFDEVIGADIDVLEESNKIKINVNDDLTIEVKTGFSFLYSIINLILSEKHKVVGKTETGKTNENIPNRLLKIVNASAELNSKNFGKMKKTNKEVLIGDGKASKKPIISYCTLRLEM
jgi:hypothetical protein